MIVSSRVLRQPDTTIIVYGDAATTTTKLSQADGLRIELDTGHALEFLAATELARSMKRLGIATLPLDEQERAVVRDVAQELANLEPVEQAADTGEQPEDGLVTPAKAALVAAAAGTEDPTTQGEGTPMPSTGEGAEPPEAGEPEPADTDGESWQRWLPLLLLVAAAAVLAILILSRVFSGAEPEAGDTATPVATTGIPTATAVTNTLVRVGPGMAYPITGALPAGESAPVMGVSEDRQWWAIQYPGALDNQGWVSAATVAVEDADSVPVVPPPAPPTPTTAPPVVITDWEGEYFDNRDLAGDPVLVRNDETISFDWGTDPPAPGMPADNWSARWTKTRDVPAGTYRISAWVDDGVRVFVDDVIVIDGWQEGIVRNYTADVVVTRGTHTVRVEYFEATGGAMIELGIGYIEEYPEWKGEYFDNPNVEGAPGLVRNDPQIAFNWGNAPPAPGLPPDYYSVRWTRTATLPGGEYLFNLNVEGGARAWLDGQLLIDDWTSGPPRLLQAKSALPAGDHSFRVEYFKDTGVGQIRAWYEEAKPDEPPIAIITGPTSGFVNQTLTYSAANSKAADGSSVTSYQWDFGDGTTANSVDVSKVYANAGAYTIMLTVTDDRGLSDQDEVVVAISGSSPTATTVPQAPTAVIVAPAQAAVGQVVPFDASQSTASSPIVSFIWNFGDGASANAVRVEHVYGAAGIYTVILEVVDQAGQSGRTQVQIQIFDQAPPPGPTATPLPTASATAVPQPTGTPLPEPTVPAASIEGFEWLLQGSIPGTTITAFFANGQVSGYAGCNNYTGLYELSGNSIETSNVVATTGEVCDDAITQQENTYLTELSGVTTYQIASGLLDIAAQVDGQAVTLQYAMAVPQ
jgi:PKD repeat protein/uncharacterized protein YraI